MRKTILNTIGMLVLVLAINTGNAQTKTSYQLPKYEKFKLPNGLTVYLMEKHEVPVISINVIIPGGAIYDGNKAGLASLTASSLQGGTKSFTKQQIEEEFDFAGASLSINSTTEFARLSAKLAVKDENKLLPMVKELLLSPTFPADEFDKEKKLELVGLDQLKESPGQVINAYWNKFYYGNYVYGNVVNGTVGSLSTLTASDAVSFYNKYYTPDGSAIAVTGDFSTKEMKVTITKLLSGWKKTATVSNPSAQAFTPSFGKKMAMTYMFTPKSH